MDCTNPAVGGPSVANHAPVTPPHDMTKCASCEDGEKKLFNCARCKAVAYCGKGCQREHFQEHKNECKRIAKDAARGVGNANTGTADDPDAKPFTALRDGHFLHNRTEEKTFQILIDCLRMRQEDVYTFQQHHMKGSIMDEETTSEIAFRAFIVKAKRVPDLLPAWWTDQKLEECVRYSLLSPNFSLAHSVEKHDVQTQWEDTQMPMKLRLLGEKIYGSPPAPGNGGAAILDMQAKLEGGDGKTSTTIDMRSLLESRG